MAPKVTKKRVSLQARDSSLAPDLYSPRVSDCDGVTRSRSPSPTFCVVCENCKAGQVEKCSAEKRCRVSHETFSMLDTLSGKRRRSTGGGNTTTHAASVQAKKIRTVEQRPKQVETAAEPDKNSSPLLPIEKIDRNPDSSPIVKPVEPIHVQKRGRTAAREAPKATTTKSSAVSNVKKHQSKPLAGLKSGAMSVGGGNYTTRSVSNCGSRSPSPRPCPVCDECTAGNFGGCLNDKQCKLGDPSALLADITKSNSNIKKKPVPTPKKAAPTTNKAAPAPKKEIYKSSNMDSTSAPLDDDVEMIDCTSDVEVVEVVPKAVATKKKAPVAKVQPAPKVNPIAVKKTISSIKKSIPSTGCRRPSSPNTVDLRDRSSIHGPPCFMCTCSVQC